MPLHLSTINIGNHFMGEQEEFYKIYTEEIIKQKVSFYETTTAERKYLWVEYLKFNKAEN